MEQELSLLVVEDDERTLEELRRILQRHTGFRLFFASLPSRALEIASGSKIDAALLDLKLPEMNGLELLGRLKVLNPDLLATIMTGYGEAGTPAAVKEMGAADFIEKPLDLNYLLAALRFQEREARSRKALRDAAGLLHEFFSMTADGVALERRGELLASNPLGQELFKRAGGGAGEEERLTIGGREYGRFVSHSGDITLHHFKDLTGAFELSRVQARNEMARLLSHELHNSLTPLKLWLQELVSSEAESEDFGIVARKASEEGLRQIERLSRLTRRFKELSSGAPLEIAETDASALARSLFDSIEPLMKEKRVTLAADFPPCFPVPASGVELYQALFNLAMNSIEAYGEKGGEIRVSFARDGHATITLSDDAGGLPPDLQENPFRAYLTTKEEGTGLGLVLSRELLRKMGGDLALENRPGKGVDAVVRLGIK